jgi:large subunit ribosomal protein L21
VKYAIIETGSKQYNVQEGDIISIERIDVKDKVYDFDKVLMAVDGDNVKIGRPLVNDAKVSCEIIGEERAEKIVVFKKRRREEYRRTRGHRQTYTKIKITKIVL